MRNKMMSLRLLFSTALLLLLVFLSNNNNVAAFAATPDISSSPQTTSTKNVVTKVAVAGATGRTGRYVVEELLKRDVEVVAMVRDVKKAEEVFGEAPFPDNLEVKKVDLSAEDDIDSGVCAVMVSLCDEFYGYSFVRVFYFYSLQPSMDVMRPFGVPRAFRMLPVRRLSVASRS